MVWLTFRIWRWWHEKRKRIFSNTSDSTNKRFNIEMGARQQNKNQVLPGWLSVTKKKTGNSKQEIPKCLTETVFFELQEFS